MYLIKKGMISKDSVVLKDIDENVQKLKSN
jgi:hypothetical protein